MTVRHRFKIVEFEHAADGYLPGSVRIFDSEDSVSSILLEKLHSSTGSELFAVESPSFAWLLRGRFRTAIFREDDPDFNVDLVMPRVSNLTGAPVAEGFSGIEARMDRGAGGADPVPRMKEKGMTPVSAGSGVPYDGLGGTLFRNEAVSGTPVYAAPPPPRLRGGDPESEAELIDHWFKKLKEVLAYLKGQLGDIDVIFRRGPVPIPEWFIEWCEKEDIEILWMDE